MKIRGGFVSNSSTSCFIIRGAIFKKSALEKIMKKLSNDEECELSEFFEEYELDYQEDEYENSDEVVLGTCEGSVDNGEVSEIETDPKKFEVLDNHIKEAFNKLGISPKVKIKTYCWGSSPG